MNTGQKKILEFKIITSNTPAYVEFIHSSNSKLFILNFRIFVTQSSRIVGVAIQIDDYYLIFFKEMSSDIDTTQ